MSKKIPIIIGLLLVITALWALITPTVFIYQLIERLEHLGYDLQLRTHLLTNKKTITNPIAIIDIDDRSLKAEGRWPWPRSKIAKLVDELKNHGAAVIAFDMFFSEEQMSIDLQVSSILKKNNLLTDEISAFLKNNSSLFDEDLMLAASLSQIDSVLAMSFLPSELKTNKLTSPLLQLSSKELNELLLISAKGYIVSIPKLQNAAKKAGFINIFSDMDGIIRRVPLVMTYENGVYPSLALQAVLSFLGQDIKLVTPVYHDHREMEGVQIANRIIPTNIYGEVFIPFIGKSFSFPYYSATDVLHHKIPKDRLLGKILFIGTSATGLGDLEATAVQNPYPGVEIQATVANGILENNFSSIPAWTYGANIVLALIFGLIAAFLFPYLGPRILGMIVLVLPISMVFINNYIWHTTGIIFSFLIPILLVLIIAIFNILYGYLFETRKREHLKEIFGQYVPSKHIDEMLKSSDTFTMRGEDREMSVLFADIRSFTTISEKMTATELVEMLNTFFTPMTEIIFKTHGTIDKYVGDLIMAFWGAPIADTSHARHAIQSAIEMQRKLNDMQVELNARGWPEIKIGIGINSGNMSVGDMGSHYRRNYTVLGDNVNLASRVESLTKFYGADIIVTENSARNQTKFIFRKLDRVRVKGKKHGIEIDEVLGLVTDLTPELKLELEQYHQALDDYFKQQWDASLMIMQQLKQKYPDKKIYDLYIERLIEFKNHPPGNDWDGIYTHKSK